ncbi:MAG TPA: universal stress protein [Acidimicrobiales bacterium]|nr:universal stress protein [Acidimicrobiales bacterium]
MADTTQKKIVVGFDGSDGSRAALDWALDESAVRGAPLEVVRAWTPGEFGTDEELSEYTQSHLEKDVSAALNGRDVQWTAVADRGAAGKVLLERATDAQMLVVGSRGHGALSGLLLGSVSSHVATHSGAAVVVIVKEPV